MNQARRFIAHMELAGQLTAWSNHSSLAAVVRTSDHKSGRERLEFPDGSAIITDGTGWAYGIHRSRCRTPKVINIIANQDEWIGLPEFAMPAFIKGLDETYCHEPASGSFGWLDGRRIGI